MLDSLIKALTKFIPRVVIVKKGFEENVLLKGFHTVRFHTWLSQPVILSSDSKKNREKVRKTARKLMKECRLLVGEDIEEFIAEAKELQKKKKKGGKS